MTKANGKKFTVVLLTIYSVENAGIRYVSAALQRAGFNPGKVDGVVGRQTLEAVDAYQKANKLARGGLTIATIERLGVQVR